MGTIDFEQKVTYRDDPHTLEKAGTVAGMAHYGGTGPAGKTCRECAEWKGGQYWSATHAEHPCALKDATCDKFLRMMVLMNGPKVPPFQNACKYFQQSDDPPEVNRDAQKQKLDQRKRAG